MSKQWYYTRDGGESLGPCTSGELKRMASRGQLLPTDRILREGKVAVTARRVKGLFAPPAPQGEAGPH